MSVSNFDELIKHYGHNIVCVKYTSVSGTMHNVALECETCNEILLEYDKFDE